MGSSVLLAVSCGKQEPPAEPTASTAGIASVSGADDTTSSSSESEGSSSTGTSEPQCPSSGLGTNFSFIWIANSGEGTVSKIDTRTGVEQGRYRTGPDAMSDPSRTSVNLQGDAAVLNRGDGRLLKIAPTQDRCIDADGDGKITTSVGPANVLPFGQDECVVWRFDTFPGARALAWDAETDPIADPCGEHPNLWVGALDANNTVHVWKLDGATGQPLLENTLPAWDGDPVWGGLYGAALDPQRDMWAIGKDNTALFHIEGDTLSITRHDAHGVTRLYGLAIDAEGNPWVTSEFDDVVLKYSDATKQFELIGGGPTGHGSLRGLTLDIAGNAWIAANNPCRLLKWSPTLQTFTHIELPECAEPVGVSLDADGFVWVVDRGAEKAYKIDPNTHQVLFTFIGLVQPYTYSDMTGAGLNLVANPS